MTTTIKKLISDRSYNIIGFENGLKIDLDLHLNDILKDDETELNYSLQENIDNILDLKIGESLNTFSNREGGLNSRIIVLRIT